MKANIYRTHTCGELTTKHVGGQVRLSGWVNARRDHGGILLIDLRDRFGLMQIRFDPKSAGDVFAIADSLRPETVVTVVGEVVRRPDGMVNKKISSGDIEVIGQEVKIINVAKTPPFEIDRETENQDEDVRLQYRYLDLRRERMQKNMQLRSDMSHFVRTWLRKERFIEIETPVMGRETPEGARDYVVPSRLYPGEFYALAQSPQQYKQLLMVAGFDRYVQMPHLMRDEDSRSDRVPEHMQIDLEMSFVERDDILEMVEALMSAVTKEFWSGKITPGPFKRIPYKEAMADYGSDKPDIRYDLKLADLTKATRTSKFAVFAKADSVQALAAPIADYSRKAFDDLTEFAKSLGGNGLAWVALREGGFESPIAKFFSEGELKQFAKATGAKEGDAILFAAGAEREAQELLGHIRHHLGQELKLADPDLFTFAWIYDFPMFDWNENEGRVEAFHHMFVQPYKEHIKLLDKEPLKVHANLFDLVLNGFELCSGSLRIWDAKLQRKVMNMIGINDQDVDKKFGHMIRAFEYGAPPHGGVGLGLDRIMALFAREKSIREVIAFPMNSRARDPMTGAPSSISDLQLRELNISLKKKKT